MASQFTSAFNSIYNVKIRCPICKEEILAHAKKCPYCHSEIKISDWQSKANIILLCFVGIIVLSMIFSSMNIIPAIIIGLIIYGLGQFLLIKIQSIINSLK